MSNQIVRNSIGSLADLANQAPHIYKMLSHVGGLRRRQRTARIAQHAAWLGAGLVLGAGLTTLFSPTTGAQVRRRLSDQAKRVRGYIAPAINGAVHAEHS